MDSSITQRFGFTTMGKSYTGHAGGTIYGWGGDLWGCRLNKICSKYFMEKKKSEKVIQF